MQVVQNTDNVGVLVVTVVQAVEIPPLHVDQHVAKSVWPSQTKRIVRTKSKTEVKLPKASGSTVRVEGDAKLELILDGKRCCMKFFGRRHQETVGISQRDGGWREQGRVWSAKFVR